MRASELRVTKRDVRLAEEALEQSMARVRRGEAPLYVPNAMSTARKIEQARSLEQQRRLVASFKEKFDELAQSIQKQELDEYKCVDTLLLVPACRVVSPSPAAGALWTSL